jgi:hypothetical protein
MLINIILNFIIFILIIIGLFFIWAAYAKSFNVITRKMLEEDNEIYKTLTDKEKDKYDKRATCKLSCYGFVSIVCAIGLVIARIFA